MSTELATGYVSLEVETSAIPRQLAAAFQNATRIGRQAGQDMARGIESGMSGLERGGGVDMSGMFSGSEQAGREGGADAASGMLDGIKGGFKGGGIATAAGAIAGIGVVAGGMAAKFFTDAMSKGMAEQQDLTMTQVKLGADDATMSKIGAAAAAAYTSGFGESVGANAESARQAIQSGLLLPDATGDEIKLIVGQLETVSQVMGEDIPNVARAAGQAVKTGLVDDASGALDLFIKAQQNGLNVSEDFLDTITEYGTQFRKLGLSGPEALGLVQQAVKAGARDTDIAADAVKEFSIRVVDGSETTKGAFESLSLNADDMTKRFATGGETARGAMTDLFTALGKIEDPVKKNEVALALFGTQAEDLGGALGALNLDNAAAEFGKFGGAAQDAADKIGSGPAAAVEKAKRTIDQAVTGMGAGLAEAVGPSLEKVANWVSAHQPEIIGFFTSLGGAVLDATKLILEFTSYSLRGFADFTRASANMMASFTDGGGQIVSLLGRITGNDTLTDFGKQMSGLTDKLRGYADTADEMANGIDAKAIPAIDKMKDSFITNGQEAQNAAILNRALGDAVLAIPDGHTIILSDNSPETTSRLEALGLKVTTLPNGTVTVTATTTSAQTILDNWLKQNNGRTIDINVEYMKATNDGSGWRAPMVFPNADGNIYSRQAQISNTPILWGEAGPEAYIPLDQGKRGRSTKLLATVADMFGYGLTPMAAGGIVPGKAFAQSVDSATYQLGGFSTSAMDCSGMVSATVNSALGLDPFTSRMATGNEGEWLSAKGAIAGKGGTGDMTIGWTTSGAAGGHTAMTLSDGTNVESNGSDGVIIGGPVGGADKMFDQFMHFTSAQLRGSDAGVGVGGTGALGVGVGGANGGGGLGTGGGTTGGGTGTGGTYDSSQIPAGVTPVWVVNFGTTQTPTADTSGTTPQTTDTTGGSGTTSTTEVQTMQQAWDSGVSKLQSAGQNFLSENWSDALGTMGLRTSGGAIQEIASQLSSKWSEILTAAIKQINAQQVAASSRYSGRS
ncbi:phage tail tape measure protein [Nocardia niigatensis]